MATKEELTYRIRQNKVDQDTLYQEQQRLEKELEKLNIKIKVSDYQVGDVVTIEGNPLSGKKIIVKDVPSGKLVVRGRLSSCNYNGDLESLVEDMNRNNWKYVVLGNTFKDYKGR